MGTEEKNKRDLNNVNLIWLSPTQLGHTQHEGQKEVVH